MIKEDSLLLSSHHLRNQLSICSIFWERVNWNISSLVILLCGLFELTRGARAPKSSASFPGGLEGLTKPFDMCHLGSCGKEPRKHLHLTDVAYIHAAVCSARLSEPVRIFFYLNIISSGPANCLKWKVLAGKFKFQQIGLFERQWHFKINILTLPHAFWKQKEIKDWYFTATSQKRRHEVPWLTSLSFVCFRFASPFHIATFWPLWDKFVWLCFFLNFREFSETAIFSQPWFPAYVPAEPGILLTPVSQTGGAEGTAGLGTRCLVSNRRG